LSCWAKTYGGSNLEDAYLITSMIDGYMLTGWTDSYNPEGGLFFAKTDLNGQIQWMSVTNNAAGFHGCAFSFSPTPDGGFIIIGYDSTYWVPGSDIFIIKTNSEGKIQWKKKYGTWETDMAYSIKPSPDGGYIIAGEVWVDSNGGVSNALIKINDKGDILWTKMYAKGRFHTIATTSDGYIAVGQAYNWTEPYSAIFVVKTNLNGEVKWAKIYKRNEGRTDADDGYLVEPTPDGGYIIGGVSYTYLESYGDVERYFIFKIDKDGNVMWAKSYGRALSNGENLPYFVKNTPDGGYIIAGETISPEKMGYQIGEPASASIILIKIDKDGNVIWSKKYRGQKNEMNDFYKDEVVNSFVLTPEGGYILAGWTSSVGAGGSDILVIKTDADGNVALTNGLIMEDITNDTISKTQNINFSSVSKVNVSGQLINISPQNTYLWDWNVFFLNPKTDPIVKSYANSCK
jgi:hypothetical protein